MMQQPAGFCDSVIVNWINEMRQDCEGYDQMIVIRDMFRGGLSDSARNGSVPLNQMNGYIAGKMTPVLQLTDSLLPSTSRRTFRQSRPHCVRAKFLSIMTVLSPGRRQTGTSLR